MPVAGPKRSVARCVLEVGDARFSVVAYGDAAKTMAGCFSGSVLTVDGCLTKTTWKTGGGKERERVEIEADRITVGPRATECVRT